MHAPRALRQLVRQFRIPRARSRIHTACRSRLMANDHSVGHRQRGNRPNEVLGNGLADDGFRFAKILSIAWQDMVFDSFVA